MFTTRFQSQRAATSIARNPAVFRRSYGDNPKAGTFAAKMKASMLEKNKGGKGEKLEGTRLESKTFEGKVKDATMTTSAAARRAEAWEKTILPGR